MNETEQQTGIKLPRAARSNKTTTSASTVIKPINAHHADTANTAHPLITHTFSDYPAIPASHPIWHVPTPSLILSPHRAADNFKAIQRAFPGATVGYAMKSNPHPSLLTAIARIEGAWFEVASKAEIQALLDIGVAGERMFFTQTTAA